MIIAAKRGSWRAYRASSTEQSDQTGLDNVLVDTNTPDLLLATGRSALDVRCGLHLPTQTNGVFLVVDNVEIDAEGGQGASQRGDSTRTNTSNSVLNTIDLDDTSEAPFQVLGVQRFARLGGCRGC